MMIPRQIAASLGLAWLGGCASFVSWQHREGLDSFVGKPAPALVAALGTPTRQWQAGGAAYLAYDYAATRYFAGEPGTRTPDSEVPFGPWSDAVQCSTVFRAVAGQVEAWSLRGQGCRGATYPDLRQFAASRLATVPNEDVRSATGFGYESYTGRSAVEDGKFYSR